MPEPDRNTQPNTRPGPGTPPGSGGPRRPDRFGEDEFEQGRSGEHERRDSRLPPDAPPGELPPSEFPPVDPPPGEPEPGVPGRQEMFPRRRKPGGSREQYPHETARRYPGGGAHIEGVPEPPARRTWHER